MPGIRENGGQYTHAATWVVLATALLGQGDRALELFEPAQPGPPRRHARGRGALQGRAVRRLRRTSTARRRTPAAAAGPGTPARRAGCTASAWRRSSASACAGDRLRFEPCIPPGWPGYEITYRYRSATYHVRVENPTGTGRGVRSVTVDGQPVPEGIVPLRGRRANARGPGDARLTRKGGEAMSEKPLTTDDDLHRLPTDQELDRLQRTTVLYYLHETNPDNGLVRDKTDPDAPCSIAAVGLALATIPAVVERGVVIRKFAAKIARRRLRSLLEPSAGTGAGRRRAQGVLLPLPRHRYRPPRLGLRAVHARLGVPVRGCLTCATYFDADTEDEAEVRRLADALYRRADWDWACNGGPTLTHGWKPETGFMPHRYEGYDEGLLLYLLAPRLADSPLAAGELRRLLRHLSVEGNLRPRAALLRAAVHPPALAPLDRFPRHSRRVHARARQRLLREQPPGDLRAAGVRDPEPARVRGLRRALLGHSRRCDGPGWVKRVVNGVERQFYDYIARGAPFGPDDGTVAPWVVVASLPFAPEIVIPTIRAFGPAGPRHDDALRLQAVVQPDLRGGDSPTGWWVTPYHFGIDQGPVVLMIENYRTGLIWDIMRRCPAVIAGLRRAGFTGGWL